jgi:glycosyltransferase involved in cell wall biosynthesis
MKILMVLEAVFPQDERVEKEIASLMAEGHEVRIATYSFQDTGFREEYEGYIIYRRRLSGLMYKLGAAMLVQPFYLGFWRRYIMAIYSSWEFEAIHIHDLPLARLGFEFKLKHGVKFVADQHEFYSNWIVQTAHYNTPLGKIIKTLSNWKRYERKYLQRADLVCTVEEPLRELYIKKRGIDPDRIVVVPNTPLQTIYEVDSKVTQSSEDLSGSFNLFYCGGLDLLRGLDTAIAALPLLREKIPDIRLMLVGRQHKHFDPVLYAKELGVEDLLEMRDWVDYRELPYEIDLGHICIFIPRVNRDEIHNTIASKIYQYMARGKPVIVGTARYMKEFVEKHEIGVVVDETSPQDFADAVWKIYSDPVLKQQMEDNAKKTIGAYYWERTVKKLTGFYGVAGQREL